MYSDFCQDTPKIKKVIERMIDSFNFPIKKPNFYVPDKSLLETLKVLCESPDTEVSENKSKALKK